MKHVGLVMLGILSIIGIPLMMIGVLIFSLHGAGVGAYELYKEHIK